MCILPNENTVEKETVGADLEPAAAWKFGAEWNLSTASRRYTKTRARTE